MGDENPISNLGDYSRPSHEGNRNTIEFPDGNNVVSLRSDTIQTTKLQNDIMMFQQHQGESLSEAWAHYKDLLQKVPHHGIDLWLQVQIFYDHVSPTTRRTINQSAGVQRLMEAHLAPKSSIQVNKITSSCEICSGPHDTQYYMENPEQAFVDYTSSRNNEVGVLSNFDAHKEKRLSSIGTQLRQQQDDMINKIDTLWRVVSEKFDNMPANDTAGNSMACVNAVIMLNFEGLEARWISSGWAFLCCFKNGACWSSHMDSPPQSPNHVFNFPENEEEFEEDPQEDPEEEMEEWDGQEIIE
ncbi:hypothetical protein Tco_0378670 [Tanacetum coccineum]